MSRIDEIMSDLREGRDPYFVVGQLEYVARMQEAMIRDFRKDLQRADRLEALLRKEICRMDSDRNNWTEINIPRPEWTARNSEDFS